MNLECISDIIYSNLAIHIDLTNNMSWVNYNTALTSISLNKWYGAYSSNIDLIDSGLTEFDIGHTNLMWNGTTLTPSDTFFTMNRIGYNVVTNPNSYQRNGISATTYYYSINPIVSGNTSEYYFDLDGGYLRGYFKLENYEYSLLPSRYRNGITIETILNIYEQSEGIFYMMGARAEDKYNKYFSGETITGTTNTTGVTTSENNFLDAIVSRSETKKNFILPEENKIDVLYESPALKNIGGNVIAFMLTQDKKLGYKYVNENGTIIFNTTPISINVIGFTMIDIVFRPHSILTDEALDCASRRFGDLIFYVNGRKFWIFNDFPEYYFNGFKNEREKQIGVPYSISWGGGSFGLMNSWHYDYQKYGIYEGQDVTYVNNAFSVENNPMLINNENISGLSLSATSAIFTEDNNPITVMSVTYTGGTNNTYFIKFNESISTLSNRDYNTSIMLYDDGFFKAVDDNGNIINSKISLLVYSNDTDINIVNETIFTYPYSNETNVLIDENGAVLHPFIDRQEYQYIYTDNNMYYGDSGKLVTNNNYYNVNNNNAELVGSNKWIQLKNIFRTNVKSGKNYVIRGILIETDDVPNVDKSLYFTDFIYEASDILVKDNSKDNLLIEQNFNTSFIGGIQKLRVYDNALNGTEILHNAIIESRLNQNIVVNKGGRIIYR